MTAPPLGSIHRGPATVLPAGASTGECVSAIGDYYGARFAGGPPLRLSISTDGPYALAAWESGAGGGMDLFRRSSTVWCRVVVNVRPTDGGGSTPSTWLTTADITGLVALNDKRARRLMNGPFVVQTLGVGSLPTAAGVRPTSVAAGAGLMPAHAVQLAPTAGVSTAASRVTVSFRRVLASTHAARPARPACARSLAAALPRTSLLDPIVHVAFAQNAAHALLSVTRKEAGGMYLYRRIGGEWCLVAGGGALTQAGLIGVDGIDRTAARALFDRLRAGGVADVR